jgi:hypothetical protein
MWVAWLRVQKIRIREGCNGEGSKKL